MGANASWLIGIRVFRMLVGILVVGAVARYLGPEQFGVLSYAISLTAIFGAIATLGFDGIIVRELVSRPEQTPQILGTAFSLRLAGSMTALLLVFLVSVCTQDPGEVIKLAVIVSVAFLPGSLEVIELWFQKNVHAKHTVIARITAVLIVSAMRLGLVYFKAPLEAFAAMQCADTLFGGLALTLAFKARGQKITAWRFDRVVARGLVRECWPLILSGFLISVCTRVDQILVKKVLGDYDVGIYYSALRINEVWGFIPSAVLTTVYPFLVAKRSNAPEKYNARLQTIFDLLTGLGYAIAIITTVLGGFLIPLIFGVAYKSAVPILVIQAWTAPIVCSALARAQYMLIEKQTILYTPIAFIWIAINIPLAIFLMGRLGITGAAFSVLISSTCSGYLTSFLFPVLRSSSLMQTKAFLLPFRLRKFIQTIKQLR